MEYPSINKIEYSDQDILEIKEIAASHILIKSIKHKTQSTRKSTNYNQLFSDSLNSFTTAKTTGL